VNIKFGINRSGISPFRCRKRKENDIRIGSAWCKYECPYFDGLISNRELICNAKLIKKLMAYKPKRFLIEPDIYAEIKKIAKKNDRSVPRQINRMLRIACRMR